MTIATSEIWRSTFNSHYEISNLGRVRSKDKYVSNGKGMALKKGRILSLSIHPKTGYVFVNLWDKQKSKTYSVHKLVALFFQDICGEYFEGAEVDHINTIRTDNRAENLRWCTRHENHLNPLTRKRYSEMNKGKKKGYPIWNKGEKVPQISGINHWKSRPVEQYSKDGILMKIWDTISMAGESLCISRTAISNCLAGRAKTAGNFTWKYKEK